MPKLAHAGWKNVKSQLLPCQIQHVLSHYDVGALTDAHWIRRGFVNENWYIQTTRGSYFLKRRHPDLRIPNVVRAQHALVCWLGRNGFPAPQIQPTQTGDTLLISAGDFYEIQRYIAGSPYQSDHPSHFCQSASMLGCYHMCAEGFASRVLCAQGKLYCPERLNEILNKVIMVWQNDRNVGKRLARLKTYAVKLSERFYNHPRLPELIIHGDYYGQNLIFKDEQIVGVVDYDKASWQPRVAELAEALIFFSSTSPGTFKHLVYPGFISWERFSKFLRYYASAFTSMTGYLYKKIPILKVVQSKLDKITPLQQNELQVLPDYINCVWLTVSLQRLIEKDFALTDFAEALSEVLVLADWSVKNTQRMTNASYKALDLK